MRPMLKTLSAFALGLFATVAVAEHSPTHVNTRADVTFTLRTDIADGKLVYISESGPTKGQINPDLRVPENAVVQINVVNGDGAVHDFAIPDFKVQSDNIAGKGSATAVVFRANKTVLTNIFAHCQATKLPACSAS